jgi:cell division protein FtsB
MRLLFALGVLLVGALAISLACSDGWERIDSLRRDLEVLEAQNASLRREIRGLAREAERLRDDPAALEDVARREYGLVRPDEEVLRFPAPRREP